MTNRREQSGFTLLEVLLAIGLTAIVMTTVTMTFRVTLEARKLIGSLSESTAAGPRIINLIERDLRGLWHYNIENNKVLVGRNMDVGSFEADRIDMITTTDSVGYVVDSVNRQQRPTLCEVGYWLKPHPKYNDLIELWRREDPMVDRDLLTEGSFQLVHDRIKTFKITYFKSLGAEAEEFFEWDSSQEDALPRRIKIEFTLERRRGSRNVISDAEVADLEGAEKTYVRHIVLDRRYQDILRPGIAMIPVLPPVPTEESAGSAGVAGEGSGEGKGGAEGSFTSANSGQFSVDGGGRDGARGQRGQPPPSSPRGGGRPPPGTGPGPGGNPPINLGDLLRGLGGGSGGGLFGGR